MLGLESVPGSPVHLTSLMNKDNRLSKIGVNMESYSIPDKSICKKHSILFIFKPTF